MRIQVLLKPGKEGGYTAVVPALPGCTSLGETKEEVLRNVRQAIDLYLEEAGEIEPHAEIVELLE